MRRAATGTVIITAKQWLWPKTEVYAFTSTSANLPHQRIAFTTLFPPLPLRSPNPFGLSLSVHCDKRHVQQAHMANSCAFCEKAAHLTCQGCIRAPAYLEDKEGSTQYCSKSCQKSHWNEHKTRCKLLQKRKMLHRAAKVIQELYYFNLRHSYMAEIKQIDHLDDETMFVHTIEFEIARRVCLLADFPSSTVASEEEALMAMTVGMCTHATFVMISSIQTILKGLLQHSSFRRRLTCGFRYRSPHCQSHRQTNEQEEMDSARNHPRRSDPYTRDYLRT